MSSSSAITVGNFDGVHLGHASLVKVAREAVGANGRVTVLSFDPHPLSILRPERTPARLTGFSRRSQMLKNLGADEVIRLEPTREFLELSARDFVAWVVQRHHPSIMVEGPDFEFGKSRSGTVATLCDLEGQFHYQTKIIESVEVKLSDGHLVRVSSSMLRWLISMGRVTDAATLLGHPYELAGQVVRGDQRGRTIGVPTANLDHEDLLLPADGVYSGQAVLPDGTIHVAAISVGRKPTFNPGSRICEAHFLDYDGPLDHYGWNLRVRFHHWVRDQIAFPGVEALRKQLQRDIERVRCTTTLVNA